MYHPLSKRIDTGFPLPLSTVYFWQIVEITIYVFFVPQDFGKNLFCRDWKFSGIEFVFNGLRCQTDIDAQFLKCEHSFVRVIFLHKKNSPTPMMLLGFVRGVSEDHITMIGCVVDTFRDE